MTRVVLLFLFVAAAHAPAIFRAGFSYDDGPAILEHPDLRTFASVPKLLFTEYWGADRANQMYRPLQQWAYLVDGAIFDFDAGASHALQILWHAGAVVVGYLLLRRVGVGPNAALFACAAFGVHPALMDASVWISGRCDVLALLCTAGSLAVLAGPNADRSDAVPSRRTIFVAASLFFFGALAKEVSLAAPAAALLLFGKRAKRAAPYAAVVLAVYGALRLAAVPGFLPGIPNEAGVVLHERGIFERAGIGCRAQWILATRLVLPWTSVADHRAHEAALPTTEVGWDGVVAALAFAAVVAAGMFGRREGATGLARRLAAAGAVFFVPVLQIWPIGAVMPERFLYVPAFFWIAAATVAVASLCARAPKVAAIFGVVVVAALGARLVDRIDVYKDDGTYFADVLRAYPNDERAWNNLGVYRMLDARPPDFDGADAAFDEANRLKTNYRRGRLNAARAALERMRVLHDPSGLDRVETALEPLLKRGDRDAFALLGRCELERAGIATDEHLKHVHFERAEEAYLRAEAFREAAVAARGFGDEARAAAHRARASETAPPK